MNDGGNNYKETVFFALGHQLRKSLMSKQLFLSGVFELGIEGGKKRKILVHLGQVSNIPPMQL